MATLGENGLTYCKQVLLRKCWLYDVVNRFKRFRSILLFITLLTAAFVIYAFFKLNKSIMRHNAIHFETKLRRNKHFDGIDSKKQTVSPEAFVSNQNSQSTQNKTFTILMWNMPSTVFIPHFSKDCGSCVATANRSLLNTSDAVVIHFANTKILPDPKLRKPNQIFVWLCRESPLTTSHQYKISLHKFDNYFNATMTYRRDSEIFFPYAEILQRQPPLSNGNFTTFFQEHNEILVNKQHLVIGIVSNCGSTRGARDRFLYILDMEKAGLKLHLFGKCFSPDFPPYRTRRATAEMSKYKFYLAFENSYHCKDYITEKLWYNAFYSGVVPIVRGPRKMDLEAVAPKGSFIATDDYESVQDLVDYIRFLDKNDHAYMEYFNWRKEMTEDAVKETDPFFHKSKTFLAKSLFQKYSPIGYCGLCKALEQKKLKFNSSIPSLHSWWYNVDNDECFLKEQRRWRAQS